MAPAGAHGGFNPDRRLLNPKFESYRLHALDQEAVVSTFDIPAPVAAPPLSTQFHVPFPEVEQRVRHNHLALGVDGELLYVSDAYEVMAVTVNPASFTPAIHRIVALSKPSEPPAPLQLQCPSVIAISANVCVVSDGGGLIYIIGMERSAGVSLSGEVLAAYQWSSAGSNAVTPLRLHHARLIAPSTVRCIISSSAGPSPSGTASSVGSGTPKGSFPLIGVDCEIPELVTVGTMDVDVKWCIGGESLPLYVAYDPLSSRYLLGSASPFLSPSTDESNQSEAVVEPKPDEIAPIPKAGENLDSTETTQISKPPPYSWTQTSDSVTVVFPLPASTPKSNIRVLIAPRNLTLLISERGEKSVVPLPVYIRKAWWDGVHADTSYWTWDKEGEGGPNKSSSVGLLSLHLDKQHEDTKWSHVFAAVGTGTGLEEDEEVPETVDPSELWLVRESLEKYTAALASGEDASGLGLGKGTSSLADQEMDDEVDSRVGSRIVFTYVSEQGNAICPAPFQPVDLLSLPFPSSSPPSAIVKHTLDGLLYTIPTEGPADASLYEWKHTATYPALAFVLASKRETKFVYHYGAEVVLAFEGGNRQGQSGGNVYIYRGAGGAKSAKQAVLRVSGGTAGALMGVQAVRMAGGHVMVACLCERELVLIRDILA